VVPGYVPFALLFALEAVAIVAWILAFGRRPSSVLESLPVCPRCARLHKRTETFARVADAVAVGALAFFVALPFVAAGYERKLTLLDAVLSASAVVAVLAVAAEIDFLIRALAAKIAPRLTWDADAGRIIGGGARWCGLLLVLYIFKAGYTGAGGTALGMIALFGGVGKELATDLSSAASIWVAAILLLVSVIVALAARWIVPMVFFSIPLTMAVHRDEHGARA